MPGLWRPRPSKAEAKATPKRPSWRLQQTVSLLMAKNSSSSQRRTEQQQQQPKVILAVFFGPLARLCNL